MLPHFVGGNMSSLTGEKGIYKVILPISRKEVVLRLMRGTDEFLARRHMAEHLRNKDEVDSWLWLEFIARTCKQFGNDAPPDEGWHYTNFTELQTPDLQVLKLAFLKAHEPPAHYGEFLDELAQNKRLDALGQALWIARELNGAAPLKEILNWPQNERIQVLQTLQIMLGLEKKQVEEQISED